MVVFEIIPFFILIKNIEFLLEMPICLLELKLKFCKNVVLKK